jgi:hypothetical protein
MMTTTSMPTRAWLTLMFIGGFLGAGQAPTDQAVPQTSDRSVTRIGNHQIGETFGVWFAINANVPPTETAIAAANVGKVLGEACKKYIHGPQWKQESQNIRSDCKSLLPIRDTGRGEFQTVVGGQPVTWRFVGVRVEEALIEYPIPDTPRELERLVEAYGAPAASKTVSYQNAYGAKWDCLEASWNMRRRPNYVGRNDQELSVRSYPLA